MTKTITILYEMLKAVGMDDVETFKRGYMALRKPSFAEVIEYIDEIERMAKTEAKPYDPKASANLIIVLPSRMPWSTGAVLVSELYGQLKEKSTNELELYEKLADELRERGFKAYTKAPLDNTLTVIPFKSLSGEALSGVWLAKVETKKKEPH